MQALFRYSLAEDLEICKSSAISVKFFLL